MLECSLNVLVSYQVGFESVAFRLTNITSRISHAVVYREGSYGSVTVSWRSGYPPGFMPKDIRLGNLHPESGKSFMLVKNSNKISMEYLVKFELYKLSVKEKCIVL